MSFTLIDDCFTLIVVRCMSFVVPIPYCGVGWHAVYDCGIDTYRKKGL